MPKIDKVKFEETLKRDAEWQGRRCKEMRDEKRPDVVATAITVSLLIGLRSLAEHKALGEADIQKVIDAFMEAAGMEEVYTPMGASQFVRTDDVIHEFKRGTEVMAKVRGGTEAAARERFLREFPEWEAELASGEVKQRKRAAAY